MFDDIESRKKKLECLIRLAGAFSKQLNDDALDMMVSSLEDYRPVEVEEASIVLLKEETFFPSVSKIITAIIDGKCSTRRRELVSQVLGEFLRDGWDESTDPLPEQEEIDQVLKNLGEEPGQVVRRWLQ